ncbi:hypothetical protein EMCRGX_G000905 [Ephydatia muelleri]
MYDSDSDAGELVSDDEEDGFIGGPFSGPDGEQAVVAQRSKEAAYQVLTPDTLSKKMFEIVDEVNAVFQLPTPYVRILLTTCKWDKEKLLERYYAGDQQRLFQEAHLVHSVYQRQKSGSGSTVKAQLTAACGAAASPGQEYICDICMLAYSRDKMYGLECGHLFCRPCWESYLKTMVMMEGRGQTIVCPGASCEIIVDEATVLELLKQQAVRQKYQLLITNSFVQDHPNLCWCPSPGCTNAILAPSMSSTDLTPVTCLCGHSFCFRCGREPHAPIQCSYLKRWLKKCDDDSETSNWIQCNTKECPKCHSTIEKNGGCNHVVCVTCKAEFCWVCLGAWEPHGSSWYQCNRFDEKDTKAARDAQAQSRQALQRYLFYCNRYMNHLKSSKMESKLYSMAHTKMKELQDHDMSWIEAQFVNKAVDILCQCRRTLMYTYSFAYYLKKNNHTYIFEDNQADLERATESLSEYLERNITRDTLNDMKIHVQDKTKYCESRRQALLDHVSEGYDNDLWECID